MRKILIYKWALFLSAIVFLILILVVGKQNLALQKAIIFANCFYAIIIIYHINYVMKTRAKFVFKFRDLATFNPITIWMIIDLFCVFDCEFVNLHNMSILLIIVLLTIHTFVCMKEEKPLTIA